MTEIEITDIRKDSQKNTFLVDVEFREANTLINVTFYKTDLAVLKEIVKELEK